jgi:hypothetical protein
MSRLVPALCSLVAAGGLGAVDFVDTSFGNQPVAIGAGARAMGMGGAFSAVADDATASTWNPAGLTQCERPEFAASMGLYYVQNTVGDEDDEETALRPEHVSGMLPFFALGCQQVVGVAWQRTFDFTRRVSTSSAVSDTDGDGNIFVFEDSALVRREGSFATLGLCYAIEPTPGVSVGVTLNQWADSWTRASHFTQNSTQRSFSSLEFVGFPPFTATTDTSTADSTRVLSGTSVVIGTWWQALPSLTVAVVAKPGYSLELETDAARTERTDDGLSVTTLHRAETSRSTLHHPPMVTLGTAWHDSDVSTVTCDATWTRWKQFYVDAHGERHSPVAFHIDPNDFDDLWTLRAGYERILILPDLVLVPRCGAVVEWLPASSTAPSPFAAEQVTASSDLWLGVTAGLSVCLRSTIWDAGVQIRHGNDIGAGQYAGPDQTADVTIATMRLGVTVQF